MARAGVSAPRLNSLGMPLIRGGKQRSSYTAHPPTVHYPFSGTPTAHRAVVIIAVLRPLIVSSFSLAVLLPLIMICLVAVTLPLLSNIL